MRNLALLAWGLLLCSLVCCSPREVPGEAEAGSVPALPEQVALSEGAGLQPEDDTLPQLRAVAAGDTVATIRTTAGDITVKLFPQLAPVTVENFVGLARAGYYNGKIIHRVARDTSTTPAKGLLLQGGSPLGDGKGGESIFKDEQGGSLPFQDEFSMELWHFRGALSMANSGPNTNLSQFFIVGGYEMNSETEEDMQSRQFPAQVVETYRELGGLPHLDWAHSVFGQVVGGWEVVEAIFAVDTGENDKPLEDITILSVTVATAAATEEPTPERSTAPPAESASSTEEPSAPEEPAAPPAESAASTEKPTAAPEEPAAG